MLSLSAATATNNNNGFFHIREKPKKPLLAGDESAIETKILGWLYPEDHPDGILCKPCPVCGYKYGTSWKKEDVPEDVVEWLFSLPDSEVKPAWV